MRKTIYLFTTLAFLASCSVHRNTISNRDARRNNENIQKANSASIAGYTALTSLQYIDRYKAIAIKEMNLYGVPASITLAQGLFESGSGNSTLARIANNHFGIKCTTGWTGKSFYRDDDNKNDCFRVYDRAEDSFRDHSLFLKRKNYTSLFALNITDYKGWAQGLKNAGYATNPNYPSILIGIIQKYNLDKYDSQPAGTETTDTLVTRADQNIVTAPKDSSIKIIPAGKTYAVRQGDTLYNISKRFGLTVDDLKALNNLADNNIKIGQVLVVVKP
jgi:flagellum-specific peptidoglycan hydrolase FlgJ